MKNVMLVSALGAAVLLTAIPARAQDDSWGWQAWGWGRSPGWMQDGNNPPGMGQGMMQRMRQIDANSDGVISDDEAAAQVESVFATMDADDDGNLTEDEYMAVRMGGGPGFNTERQAAMQARKKERFAAMDPDKDGKVTQAEFITAAKQRFSAADADKDGKVTPWEFRAQRWH